MTGRLGEYKSSFITDADERDAEISYKSPSAKNTMPGQQFRSKDFLKSPNAGGTEGGNSRFGDSFASARNINSRASEVS
jgi:hypothetical protein